MLVPKGFVRCVGREENGAGGWAAHPDAGLAGSRSRCHREVSGRRR